MLSNVRLSPGEVEAVGYDLRPQHQRLDHRGKPQTKILLLKAVISLLPHTHLPQIAASATYARGIISLSAFSSGMSQGHF